MRDIDFTQSWTLETSLCPIGARKDVLIKQCFIIAVTYTEARFSPYDVCS